MREGNNGLTFINTKYKLSALMRSQISHITGLKNHQCNEKVKYFSTQNEMTKPSNVIVNILFFLQPTECMVGTIKAQYERLELKFSDKKQKIENKLKSGTNWLTFIKFSQLAATHNKFQDTTMYITNITGEIKLPWEPGLLEWLQEHYPASKYRVVELT